jgi:hypothetical protein
MLVYSPVDELVRMTIGSVGLPNCLILAVTELYVSLESQPRNWPQPHRNEPWCGPVPVLSIVALILPHCRHGRGILADKPTIESELGLVPNMSPCVMV